MMNSTMTTPTIMHEHSSITSRRWFLSTSAWNLDQYADFHMPDTMMKDSWPVILALVTLYIGIVFAVNPLKKGSRSIQRMMPKSFVDLQTTRHAWNSGLALYSICGSLHMVFYVIHQVSQNGVYSTLVYKNDSFYEGPVGFWFLLFVYGKIFEFGDTVFLLLSGKRVIFLHWYHHATVLPCCWYAVLARIPMLAPCAALNYSVHAVMYGYFALNDCNDVGQAFRIRWGKRITTMQCFQFVLQLIIIATGAYDRWTYQNPDIPPVSIILSTLIISSYLYLFLQFAEEKYAYRSQLGKTASNLLYLFTFSASNKNKPDESSRGTQMPWQDTTLSLTQQFEEATKTAVMLYGAATEQDLLAMYGYYKQAKEGPIPVEVIKNASTDKERTKAKAWQNAETLSTEEAQLLYIAIMDQLNERNRTNTDQSKQRYQTRKKAKIAKTQSTQSTMLFPVRIAGHGRYLPKRIVQNKHIEEMGGFELSSQEKKRTGVIERRYVDVDNGESLIENGCAAIRAACDKAGIAPVDLDLIVGGFGGHQVLPDDACLVQRELGLGESGIRAFTVHATCLSFVVALEVAGSLMRDGKYRNVAVFASSISSVAIWKTDPHTAGLFGDGAAAVILQPSDDPTTGILGCHMETYGVGADACTIRGGGNYRPPYHPRYDDRMGYFAMNGQQTLSLVSKYARGGLHNFMPGLETGLQKLKLSGIDRTVDIDWVVPHQASQVALDSLAMFGWPKDRILRTIHKYGNVVAASIPLTLCDGIDSGRIQRGDTVLLCGTSAGLSVGSMLLTY